MNAVCRQANPVYSDPGLVFVENQESGRDESPFSLMERGQLDPAALRGERGWCQGLPRSLWEGTVGSDPVCVLGKFLYVRPGPAHRGWGWHGARWPQHSWVPPLWRAGCVENVCSAHALCLGDSEMQGLGPASGHLPCRWADSSRDRGSVGSARGGDASAHSHAAGASPRCLLFQLLLPYAQASSRWHRGRPGPPP